MNLRRTSGRDLSLLLFYFLLKSAFMQKSSLIDKNFNKRKKRLLNRRRQRMRRSLIDVKRDKRHQKNHRIPWLFSAIHSLHLLPHIKGPMRCCWTILDIKYILLTQTTTQFPTKHAIQLGIAYSGLSGHLRCVSMHCIFVFRISTKC